MNVNVQTILFGIVAGAASALLFASIASGSPLAILLFYLSSLPIMVAAVGWGHVAGLIAAFVAAFGLAAGFGGLFFLTFLVGVGFPAWWLGYLTLLGRPSGSDPADGIEWYPVGHLVVWAALLGALVVSGTIATFGTDAETFRAALKKLFENILRAQLNQPQGRPLTLPNVSDTDRLLEFFVIAVPAIGAILSTVINLVNLWLASLIVSVSGGLKRPWPRLSAMTFPSYAPGLLAAAVAATFVPGMIGIVAGVLAASLLIAFAVLGLAVLHSITTGVNGRRLILFGVYFVVGLFGWPVLAAALIGLAESSVGIRARFAGRLKPPAAPT